MEPKNSLIRSGLRIVLLSLLDLFLWALQTTGLVLKALTSGKGAFFGVLGSDWQSTSTVGFGEGDFGDTPNTVPRKLG